MLDEDGELNVPGVFVTYCGKQAIYRSTENVSADELHAMAKAEMALIYPDNELQNLDFAVADVAWGCPPVVSVYVGNIDFDPFGYSGPEYDA